MKSFWQALLQYMINENRQHWYENQEGFYSIISDELVEPEPSDLAMFTTYGLVIRLTLLFDFPLLPISPFLLSYLVTSFTDSVHFPFVHALAPSTFTRLDTWPSLTHRSRSVTFTEGDIILGTDPFNLIIEFLPESAPPMVSLESFQNTSNICIILGFSDLPMERVFCYIARLKDRSTHHIWELWCYGHHQTTDLYTCSRGPQRLSCSPSSPKLEFIDRRKCVFVVLHHCTYSFQTFHDAGTAKKIIAAIGMGRRVTSPDTIIDLLRPQPSNTVLGLSADEEGWIAHLKRYLRGNGYPRADSIVVNEDKRTIASGDNTLRSRLLLKCVTGSEYVDINRSAIHVSLTSY